MALSPGSSRFLPLRQQGCCEFSNLLLPVVQPQELYQVTGSLFSVIQQWWCLRDSFFHFTGNWKWDHLSGLRDRSFQAFMNCTVFFISRARNRKWPADWYQTRQKVKLHIFRWKTVTREEADTSVHSMAPRMVQSVRGLDLRGTSVSKCEPRCTSGPPLGTEKFFLFASLIGTRALMAPATRLWGEAPLSSNAEAVSTWLKMVESWKI